MNIRHKVTNTQEHKIAHKLTSDYRILQELTFFHQYQIEQRIMHELSQNLALELEKERDLLEECEPQEHDDDWNEDYDKPIDEYETGDSLTSQEIITWDFFDIASNLEQSVTQRFFEDPDQLEQALQDVDYYRIHGCLPEDADPKLYEDLTALEKSVPHQTIRPNNPTFEVIVEDDRVEADVVPVGLNLRYVRGLGLYSTSAKKFIELIHSRNKLLNDMAFQILETLQGDFFRQPDLDTALRYLVPVTIKKLSTLGIKSPFKIDKKYLSKLGDHLVSCRLGTFSLNCFLPQKAQLVRLWVDFAIKEGMYTKKEQLDWIGNQIKKRVMKWDSSDIRHEFISPLKSLTINDIKYVRRINKLTSGATEN